MPLSRNLWAARSGANALIASGSVVNDTYQEYVGRVEGQVALNWQAEKPASLFSDAPLTAEIDETGQLTARFSDQLWVDYTTQRNADQIILTINNVVRASDATRLAWGGTEGAGSNLPACQPCWSTWPGRPLTWIHNTELLSGQLNLVQVQK